VKIAQVVTYISSDAAFGGPVSVAVAQAVELARNGHQVELLAGWDGVATVQAPGVTVKLFRTRSILPAGFSGMIAHGLLSYVRANYGTFDAFHIHLARDLITLPVARFLSLKGAAYVVQPHGMVVPDSRLRARILDMLAVRHVLRDAAAVLAYKGVDDEALAQLSNGTASIELLVNGVEGGDDASDREQSAVSDEILFMARLHPRKRVMAFAEMARTLYLRGATYRFVVVGPDEGDLAQLRAFIDTHDLTQVVTYEGAISYSEVRQRLRGSAAYVLPSINEPFPVTVLEAMAVGTPCIITDSCGLAPYFQDDSAGLVTDGTPNSMADAVQRLMDDTDFREMTVSKAKESIQNRFSIRAVAEMLLGFYAGTQRAS
jgi:glycosyltransferase involved in cell wall biosynthesis